MKIPSRKYSHFLSNYQRNVSWKTKYKCSILKRKCEEGIQFGNFSLNDFHCFRRRSTKKMIYYVLLLSLKLQKGKAGKCFKPLKFYRDWLRLRWGLLNSKRVAVGIKSMIIKRTYHDRCLNEKTFRIPTNYTFHLKSFTHTTQLDVENINFLLV